MITTSDYLSFVDEALDAMIAIVEELGDERANRRPDLPSTNTPYVILTHCLGVMEYWGGHVVSGRMIERDRDAEFRASGAVADLVVRARRSRVRLGADLAECDPLAPPRGSVRPRDQGLPLARSQGGALMHLYEELARHLGQMEGCRDVLDAPWARLASQT